MKLLAISEHYYPRIGGTVNYVHETLCALSDIGIEVDLLVPGPAPKDLRPKGMIPPPYRVQWIDAGYPAEGDPSREQRYDFCQKVDALALKRAQGANRPDVLHVLFGLFVMEKLNTSRLRGAGLPCVATVHNVPPMECRLVPDTAPLLARLRETLRLKAVEMKNAARIKKHTYDLYVVPSEQVRGLLAPLISQPVSVIGHGRTNDLHSLMHSPARRHPHDGPVQILTVGGYAPHKRQHLIPQVAALLRAAGLAFEWDVVGPTNRISGYFDDVAGAVVREGLAGVVRTRGSVPFSELAGLYDTAHLYVQPSIEEGFCITALDAAAAGLPVIACPAGALALIAEVSGGTLVHSATGPLAHAILDFVRDNRWADAAAQGKAVRSAFSWHAAACALVESYASVIEQQQVPDHA